MIKIYNKYKNIYKICLFYWYAKVTLNIDILDKVRIVFQTEEFVFQYQYSIH